MSRVFAVEITGTGLWMAGCCDDRCAEETRGGDGMHDLAEYVAQPIAERAAAAHRRLLATMPDPAVYPPRASQCPTCGQAKAAVTSLQEQVRRLERQLADAGGGEQR